MEKESQQNSPSYNSFYYALRYSSQSRLPVVATNASSFCAYFDGWMADIHGLVI